MNLKNPKLLFVFVVITLLSNSLLAQTTSTDNTLGSTGVTAIQSTTNSNYQLTVGGAVKLFHSGNSGLSSPSLYLINTSTSGRKYFLNSDDAGSFRILDSAFATPRFLINSSGYIGVGTASPNALFHVNGDVISSGRLLTGTTGFYNSDALQVSGNATILGNITGVAKISNNNYSAYSYLDLPLYGSYGWRFYTPNAAHTTGLKRFEVGNSADIVNATFSNSNVIVEDGKVGIGTTSPQHALDIANGSLRVQGSSAPSTGAGAELAYSSGASYLQSYDRGANAWNPLILRGSTARLYGGNSTVGIDIDVNGNVGIGNATPTRSLDVAGLAGLGNSFVTNNGGTLYFASASGGIANPGAFITGEKTGTFGTRIDFLARDGAGASTKNVMSVSGEYGYVGIGTTTPTAQLHTTGTVRFAGLTNDNSLSRILATDANGNFYYRDASTLGGSGSPQWTTSTNDIYNSNSGNVGIGTSSPTAKLHVVGTSKIETTPQGTSMQIVPNDLTNGSITNGYTGLKISANLDNSAGEVHLLDLQHTNTAGGTPNANAYLLYSVAGYNGNNSFVTIPHTGGMVIGKEKNTSALGASGLQIPLYITSPLNGASSWQGYFANAMGVHGALIENTAFNNAINDASGSKVGLRIMSSGTLHNVNSTATNYGLYVNATGADKNYAMYAENGKSYFKDNVGIGTAIPTAFLHVQSQGGTNSGMLVEATNSALYAAIELKNDFGDLSQLVSTGSNFNSGGIIDARATTLNTNSVGGIRLVAYNATAPILFATGGLAQSNERMRIDASGNVGIGTTTPNVNTKLDVAGNIYSNGIIAVGPSIDWTKITGNTDPTLNYKLAVNGNAIFERAKVKLNTTWPDYVFKPTFKLPSLTDLEAYLIKNNHLPDVPSADEVEKNGIDLGDNQTILLKKVEELTLYMIELNKKVEALIKENEELKKKGNTANR